MPCTPVKLPNGFGAIVCSGRQRLKRCAYCSRPCSRLCDFPILRAGKPATCDAPICDRCTWSISGDRDLCRTHAPLWDVEHDRPRVGPGAAAAVERGGE